ncbi:Ger(x)C family spore germination protein [Bacillus thuringiensis]|uniref:Ger(x)C family spore germination protein n=1 Tax=Bacillus thuringiensis TaxID=1428 RepID=UPI0020CE3ABA|nr:Ger(x)C family spore germination protein [Bacillus thuringiensis]MED3182549.1 Ger(x)C family spore germination protein [Bacillus thuringiensis]
MRPVTYLLISILLLCIFPFHIERPIPIENTSFTFAFGIDVNPNEELVFYSSNPVFSMEAKETKEIFNIKAQTSKQVQDEIDRRTAGINVLSKMQVILIGKKLLTYKNWPSLLDFIYRDYKSTVTPLLIVVDGLVSDVIHFSPENKPRISLFLKSLITSSKLRGETVETSLQEFHRQTFEKGITPVLPKIKKHKEIFLTGSSLLTKNGQYKTSLDPQETALLRILQGQKSSYSFTIPTCPKPTSSQVMPGVMSFTGQNQNIKIKSSYKDGKYQFYYNIHMHILLNEYVKCSQKEIKVTQLEKKIQEHLEKKLQILAKKIQYHQIDPIGLGVHARAFHYKEYKKVQNEWGKTLSNATIHFNLDVEVKTIGVIK